MHDTTKFTMTYFLISLSQRLLAARMNNDKEELRELKHIFGMLVEASYSSKHNEAIGLLVDLEDATRDSMAGVSWKSEIPSEDTIRSAFTT